MLSPEMRARVHLPAGSRGVLAFAAILAVGAGGAGCGRAAAQPVQSAAPSPVTTRWPAGLAGGACELLEYEVVERTTGAAFDVAAAATTEKTFTCVLQRRDASYPDLTLSVTSTGITAATYRSAVVPAKSNLVDGLGMVGYRIVTPPADGAGSAVEIGWLAGNGRMLTLQYRSEVGADPNAMVDGVTALAKKIDTGSV